MGGYPKVYVRRPWNRDADHVVRVPDDELYALKKALATFKHQYTGYVLDRYHVRHDPGSPGHRIVAIWVHPVNNNVDVPEARP